ncbi:hypothetical protein GCM10007874_02990 [Labrys miyagiensis]|uniref:AAA+ ATPase domain-containing protein n=1 Tax=Labrys miyagiensis TaxID=346912 RepID=A0ABQ6CBT7_9HYPH|nr:AAA family ATPase [Labrys miyagiensis]GLS17284.1 hypothetical protein GCM10007874_02990 [Labrys miyagiensis]
MALGLTAEAIAYALEKPSRSGRGFVACCPAHDDKKPSLYLADGADGGLIRKCRAGCSTAEVDEALKRLGLWEPRPIDRTERKKGRVPSPDFNSAQIVPEAAPPPDWRKIFGREPTKVYSYRNEAGALLHFVARFDESDGRKDFRPLVWTHNGTGDGKWLSRAYNSPRPLYGLVDLAEAPGKPVLIVEGEKAADAARSIFPECVVLSWSGGAGAVNKADWRPLKGRQVTLWPDNDDAGRAAMSQVAITLRAVGAQRVVLVPVPKDNLPEKWDLADHAPSVVDLDALLAAATDANPGLRAHILTSQQLKALHVPDRDWIVRPFLSTSSLNMIYAARGIGKTWLALSVAIAVAYGTDFVCYQVPKSRIVLYIDGEMALADLKSRVSALDPGDSENLLLLPSERLFLSDKPLNINAEEDQKRIAEVLVALSKEGRRPDLIILDNLSSLSAGIDENDNTALDSLLRWLTNLRHQGYAILLVHHAGKSGDQRGASRREDLLDTSIKLSRPEVPTQRKRSDERNEDEYDRTGAYFKLEFPKTRNIRPMPDELAMSLIPGEDGLLIWKTSENLTATAADKLLRTIARRHPRTQADLSEKAGLTAGRISQLCKELRERGDLSEDLSITREGRQRLIEIWPDLETELFRQDDFPI